MRLRESGHVLDEPAIRSGVELSVLHLKKGAGPCRIFRRHEPARRCLAGTMDRLIRALGAKTP